MQKLRTYVGAQRRNVNGAVRVLRHAWENYVLDEGWGFLSSAHRSDVMEHEVTALRSIDGIPIEWV